MGLEEQLTEAITTDGTMAALFPALPSGLRAPSDWWFAASSVGIGPNVPDPPKPWMAWNELPSTPFAEVSETSDAQTRVFAIYAYGHRGDPETIYAILQQARRITKVMAPFVLPDGTRCSASTWDGISGILPSDDHDGICRFGTVRFVVSG